MDVSKIISEHPVSDYSWVDEETFVPKDKDLSKLDELSFTEGGMDLGMTEAPPETITKQMKVRHAEDDIESVLLSARVLVNQGLLLDDVDKQLRYQYPPEILTAAKKELGRVFNASGVIGVVAADLRAKNNREYDQLLQGALNSPYKKHFKVALFNKAQMDSQYIYHQRRSSVKGSDGSIDGILASEGKDITQAYHIPFGIIATDDASCIDESMFEQEIKRLALAEGVEMEPTFAGLQKGIKEIQSRKRKAKLDVNPEKTEDTYYREADLRNGGDILVDDAVAELPEQEVNELYRQAEQDADAGEWTPDVDVDMSVYVEAGFEPHDEIMFGDKDTIGEEMDDLEPLEEGSDLDVAMESYIPEGFEAMDEIEVDDDRKAESEFDIAGDYSFDFDFGE